MFSVQFDFFQAGGEVYFIQKFCNIHRSYRNLSEYCYTEEARQAFIQKYCDGQENGSHTQRYKALGDMNPEQLWETTTNIETRILQQVTIDNAANVDYIFSMPVSYTHLYSSGGNSFTLTEV